MMRVLLLSPDPTDADVDRHADSLAQLSGVGLRRWVVAAEDSVAFLLRTAADLARARRSIDVVIAVGPTALSAANLAWRGPLVHVPVGRLTRTEARLGRSLGSRADFRIVTTSANIARQAMERVVDHYQVAIIRPPPARSTLRRAAVRDRLGISAGAVVYHVPGLARPGSGHRLALWACSILAFREPASRVLVATGGPRDGTVKRFARSTQQYHSLISATGLSAAELAAAADVVICAADGAPDRAALESASDQGVAIVGLRSTWDRERLFDVPATLIDPPLARLIAKAALLAAEGERPVAESIATPPSAVPAAVDWQTLLDSIRAADAVRTSA